jgi:hypothetical protein
MQTETAEVSREAESDCNTSVVIVSFVRLPIPPLGQGVPATIVPVGRHVL